jgi:hypothetical protein
VAVLGAADGALRVTRRRLRAVAVACRCSETTASLGFGLLGLLRLTLLLVLQGGLAQVLVLKAHAITLSGTEGCSSISGLSTRDFTPPGLAEAIGGHLLGTRHRLPDESSATLVLTLESEGSSGAASSRRTVGTSGLGRGLNPAEVFKGRCVRSGSRVNRLKRVLRRRLRTPSDMVQFVHLLVVHDSAKDVVDLEAVVDAKTRAGGGGKNVLAVGAPLANTGVARFDRSYLLVVLLQIVDIHLASQVSKASNNDESTVRGENDGVARSKVEAVLSDSTLVEDGGLRRHVAVNHTELFAVRRPSNIVDGALLVELNSRIESTAGAQDVQVGFAVVTLVALVDLGLRKHNHAGALVVPVELNLVSLEESLLGHGRGELRDVEDLDSSGLALAFGDEHGHTGVVAGRQSEVRNALDTELVPYGSEVIALVELNLVGDGASAELLVVRVLQVPASLVLLDKLANNLTFSLSNLINGAPHLQVLDRIAILVLGRPLPGDDVCAGGREAELVDVIGRQGGDDVAVGSIDNGDVLNGSPSEEAAVRRVFATSEVAFGALESRLVLVDRRGVEDANVLGSAVCVGCQHACGRWWLVSRKACLQAS